MKIFLILLFNLILIFGCLCSSITETNTVSTASFNLNIRIRELLLGNLYKFHKYLPMDKEIFNLKKTKVQTYNLNQKSINLPGEIDANINGYLDVESELNYSSLNSYARENSNCFITMELNLFNEYYVFEEDWFNRIMFSILRRNFPVKVCFNLNSKSVSSEEIYDYLELMTLKYIVGEYKQNIMPKYTYLAILSFFHETIYGADAVVPVNEALWRISFFRRVQLYNLPLTKAFYEQFNRCLSKSVLDLKFNIDFDEWLRDLEFLSNKPNIEQKIIYEGIPDVFPYPRSKDFRVIHIENKNFESFRDAYELVKDLKSLGFESSIIYDKIIDTFFDNDIFTIQHILRNSLRLKLNDFDRAIVKKLPIEDLSDLSDYIWSRDTLNPFKIEEFDKYALRNNDELNNILNKLMKSNHISNLIKMEIISKLVRSKYLQLGLGRIINSTSNFLLNSFVEIDNSSIFELILVESDKEINFFHNQTFDYIFNISVYKTSKRNLKLIFNYLNRKNPLALLFFSSSFLNEFREEIYEKFADSMHVKYKFEEEFTSFQNQQNFKFNVPISGRTFCFKNIIRIHQDTQLKLLFGLSDESESKSNEVNDCCGAECDAECGVYTVGKFLYDAKFVLCS